MPVIDGGEKDSTPRRGHSTSIIGDDLEQVKAAKLIKTIGWFVLASGAIFLVAAIAVLVWRVNAMISGEATEGQVIDVIERPGENNSTFSPVFTFTVESGTTYVVTNSYSTSPPIAKKGQLVMIYYDGDNPSDAFVGTWLSLWGMSLLLLVLAGCEFLFGAIAFYIAKKMTVAANASCTA